MSIEVKNPNANNAQDQDNIDPELNQKLEEEAATEILKENYVEDNVSHTDDVVNNDNINHDLDYDLPF